MSFCGPPTIYLAITLGFGALVGGIAGVILAEYMIGRWMKNGVG